MTEELIEKESVEVDKRIHDVKQKINSCFIELGKDLKLMRDKRLYESLGYETFESYIAQGSLSFGRRLVYAFIGIVEDYVDNDMCKQLHIAEIDWSKLDRIRQFKETKEFSEWIEKARTLSLSDLNLEVKEAKGNSNKIVPLSKVINDDSYEKRKCIGCGNIRYLDFRTVELKGFKINLKREIESCEDCANELFGIIVDEIDSFEEIDSD